MSSITTPNEALDGKRRAVVVRSANDFKRAKRHFPNHRLISVGQGLAGCRLDEIAVLFWPVSGEIPEKDAAEAAWLEHLKCRLMPGGTIDYFF